MAARTTAAHGNSAAMQATWDAAAAGWDDNGALIRNWLRVPTAALLDAAGVRAGHRVLDVAAGAGDQTIDIARRVGPTGYVHAVDISPLLVERAQANLARAGCANADVRIGDGEALRLDASFDAAVCRLGLMFYADPLAGLIEIRRAMKSGGRAAVLVFAGPEHNPLIVEQLAIAARHAGIPQPDPCGPGGLLSLGNPVSLAALFHQADFEEVRCEIISAPMKLQSAKAYVDFLRSAAAPIMRLASNLQIEQQAALWAKLYTAFANYQGQEDWIGPNTLLLASGRARLDRSRLDFCDTDQSSV